MNFVDLDFETELEKVVNLLPPLIDANNVSFPIRYDFGDKETLDRFMLLNKEVGIYPLIWCLPSEDVNEQSYLYRERAEIIIATKSTKHNEFNRFHIENSYKKILYPTLKNLIKALNSSNISFFYGNNYSTEKFVNYRYFGEGSKDQLDVWNVIKLKAKIKFSINNKCINNNIIF